MTTIQQMDLAVPYHERHYRTKAGTTLVWPFLNLEPTKSGPELFLDNNALNNVQWLADVPDNIRDRCVANPFMAIQEQWFSNSVFREDPVARIDSWTSYLAVGSRVIMYPIAAGRSSGRGR